MTATTAQIDYSRDWRYWDNTESVDVTMERAGGVSRTVPISDAFRGDVEGKISNYPELIVSDKTVIWSVPYELLCPSNTLQEVNEIEACDGIWIVDQATLITIGSSKYYWLATSHKKHA